MILLKPYAQNVLNYYINYYAKTIDGEKKKKRQNAFKIQYKRQNAFKIQYKRQNAFKIQQSPSFCVALWCSQSPKHFNLDAGET